MATVSVTFQPGDRVQQTPAAAPPVMTVIQVGSIGQVECEWYVSGNRNTGWFAVNSLHLIPPTP